MTFTLQQLTKDIVNVDVADILSCWQWRLTEMQAIVTISCLGDIFYWVMTMLFTGFKLIVAT